MSMKTTGVKNALFKRYPPEAYALMFEVADATGARHRRWADALAMGLWPSRGLTLTGFEIKASRTDWLKEFKQPEKAEAIAAYCHYWFLVVADKSIVKEGELPENWGLQCLNEKGELYTIKPAPPLSPQPMTFEFIAAMLRAAAKPAVYDDKCALARAREEGRKAAAEQSERVEKRLREEFIALQRQVLEFENHAGMKITDRWGATAKRVGEVVREVLDGKHDFAADRMKRIRDSAKEIFERTEREIAYLESAS